MADVGQALEREFLQILVDRGGEAGPSRLPPADRVQDRMRQGLRQAGYIRHFGKKWQITKEGRAYLAAKSDSPQKGPDNARS